MSSPSLPPGQRPDHRPDRYVVLGHPVAHSQSPFIHAEFARQTGEHIAYGRIESPLDGFAATVRSFIASADPAAGLGPARGCNITVPFKFQVLPLAKRASGSTWNLKGTVMLQPRAGPRPRAASALAMNWRTVASKPSSGHSMRP